VLITAGPTREPIDPVRFISNASTGAQGAALAAEALGRGYAVDLVHGPLEVDIPEHTKVYPVVTTREMLAVCARLYPDCDILIGAAAVSDYRPRQFLRQKRKRGPTPWTLELEPTEDILAALRQSKAKQLHAAFALETTDILENALQKLQSKDLDWIVANSPDAIGATRSSYFLLGANGTRIDLGTITKREVAKRLFDAIEDA
jgi:phosphopantothenoylcysteine decarboxylase/phosphopantothenate--cysteine ligase